jgi:RHS repeat-associated protein
LTQYIFASLREEFHPQFDDDGNQTLVKTATGVWQVTYNGENRPVLWTLINSFTPNSSTPTLLSMSFDRMGRRVQYLETCGNATNENKVFIYDGYLQVANFDFAIQNAQRFAWDPTEPIATRPLVFYDSAEPMQFYTHDGNKNVSESLVDNGASFAHYEYSPFGSAVLQKGERAKENPWRFSSEFGDDLLGLLYYNYRHCNTTMGRWVARDPIDLLSGWPEYGFCLEDAILHYDCLGLFWEEVNALDDIISFGVDVLRNVDEIHLSEDLLILVSEDPAMVKLDNEIVLKVQGRIVDELYPLRRRNFRFKKLEGEEKPKMIGFGGNRANANMIDQLKGFWKPEYRATWRVGANPLTWMIRNTSVTTKKWESYVFFNCETYFGVVDAWHSFDDILDLRPRRHNKNEFSLLLDPRSDPYDAVTIILGTIWHDILGRRDDLHVKGDWIKRTLIGGNW